MFRLMLVLSSNRKDLELPLSLRGLGQPNVVRRSDCHVSGRSRGSFALDVLDDSEYGSQKVLIPQRNKEMTFYGNTEDLKLNTLLLSELDSQYPGLTQLEKYLKVYPGLSGLSASMVETSGTHGSFSFFAFPKSPVYRYGIVTNHSVLLYISTEDLVPSRDYYFYRFPTLLTGPMFISTQGICSKWWRWSSTFKGDSLKSFNVLEAWMRNH